MLNLYVNHHVGAYDENDEPGLMIILPTLIVLTMVLVMCFLCCTKNKAGRPVGKDTTVLFATTRSVYALTNIVNKI